MPSQHGKPTLATRDGARALTPPPYLGRTVRFSITTRIKETPDAQTPSPGYGRGRTGRRQRGVAHVAPVSPFAVPQARVPIAGSAEAFAVRRIRCIGRHYAARAQRARTRPREPPFFFQKPSGAVQFVAAGSVTEHAYPTLTKNDHHEFERVAALRCTWGARRARRQGA